ncbi:Uncharacterised protein [uncultured archaeon]|nr:Uncharacterised protein [uncultured archaeon]
MGETGPGQSGKRREQKSIIITIASTVSEDD